MNRVRRELRRERIARAVARGFTRRHRWERRTPRWANTQTETPFSAMHRERAERKRARRALRNLSTSPLTDNEGV
jgi:hypothetical protein